MLTLVMNIQRTERSLQIQSNNNPTSQTAASANALVVTPSPSPTLTTTSIIPVTTLRQQQRRLPPLPLPSQVRTLPTTFRLPPSPPPTMWTLFQPVLIAIVPSHNSSAWSAICESIAQRLTK
ncbi:hypothetical protein SprV_0602147500 [Sparganum proliferum]